ncbi:MAG: DUF1045 domain-containing protein [Hyphomicrobiales bacterium]
MLNCAHLDNRHQKGLASCHSTFARYAIYYTPQPGTALAAFGRSWFGRANDGATLQAFSTTGLPGSGFAKVPAVGGRYTGLHAIIRAPFALRNDVELQALKSRLITFAARREAVETGPLTLARSGRYLVLRPVEPRPALDWLAGQCQSAFEDFAVDPRDDDSDDTQHQRLLLRSFGHPKTMSEYRFSITLTGPLDKAHLERVSQALWPVIEDICASGITVDGLSLFGDVGDRMPMRMIGRCRLGA